MSDTRYNLRNTGRGNPDGAVSGVIDDDHTPVDPEPPPVVPSNPLDDVTEVLDDGTRIYRLKYPLENPTEGDPEKLRFPPHMYARNVREASAKSEDEVTGLFYLACSLARIPPKVMDRLDARDYAVVTSITLEIARKNSVAASS